MSQLALEGLPAGRTTEAAAPDAIQVRELQPADFSRWDEFVSGGGSSVFQKNWGFERQPLHYEYLLVRGKRVPEHNPLNANYRLLIKMWKRLPLPLANLIGPHIVKSLG
jgi:hypothetical protein